VEDESNQSLIFKRNVIRHQVLPLFETHFPGYLETMLRSARCCALEHAVLTELLHEKLLLITSREGNLAILHFKSAIFEKASNDLKRQLLRAWITEFLGKGIHERQLEEVEKLLSAEHYGKSAVDLPIVQGRVILKRDKTTLRMHRQEEGESG
jgi:tRNA(Ile)-lysidine synthase